ncbi:PspC domain-containing protein [Natronospirillum operosum]|uniref:PspC domain-containing protein n=1 Tax=Natronospirillum operosum TaxID=2759953 RepID=A0A4Z0W8X3_9GAMM|nr:PspC domain-containing protein [Natronospirillum operosum]TGG93449.1 PspC domain-containing protein [Natronospirillum operosum]
MSQFNDFWEKRRQGYGMNLYRNKKKGWLGGVCAGLGDHLNIEPWILRLIAVGALMMFTSLAIFAYLAACILLAKRPKRLKTRPQTEYDETAHQDRPRSMFSYPDTPSERLRTARERLDDVLNRVETMERYVTSKRYNLDREFSKIQD